ncbi:hypothetical protein LTR51_002024 [Lithohypha guttulata]|nr:hypothetical protein LTR51_002024 [Lithohypha guttulata]
MVRKYEYVIHGRPLSSDPEAPLRSPLKTLSVRKDHNHASNLRALYRNSIPDSEHLEHVAAPEPQVSSPISPDFPPTPPTAEDEISRTKGDGPVAENDEVAKLRSLPATPVNGHSPPTPDHTPPREQLKVAIRPFLGLRPSMASTRAESFRTAREQMFSDDEDDYSLPKVTYDASLAPPLPALPPADLEGTHTRSFSPVGVSAIGASTRVTGNDNVASSPTLPADTENAFNNAAPVAKDIPAEQSKLDHNAEPILVKKDASHNDQEPPAPVETGLSTYDQVTVPAEHVVKRDKSLRDRLKHTNTLQNSASTEAFANVIGWNDGGPTVTHMEQRATNRWSGISNPSAVEAYVVESSIKPRKRGTLRKVVKNDSLRSVSSPIPHSNRNSLQSTSDSPHRLIHKKQKLNNQNRWSSGSDISKRTLSWGSSPAWAKQEVIRVAVIPERHSSLQSSASSSRRHSRSISGTSAHAHSNMPPVSTPGPRRKRAFSDSHERSPSIDRPLQVPVRRSSLSTPTSRNGTRSNSITSEQFSLQREQAEKDLRSTLERMESERLSASLRRSSRQSSSPTPAPKDLQPGDGHRSGDLPELETFRQGSLSIEINTIIPGTKEWAELRPATLTGTPFSQASMLSASPDIVEARIINFFPHNNKSLQLIKPNRLSETPAVRALKDVVSHRAHTLPAPKVNVNTPRTSDQLLMFEQNANSPLRHPRKPPEPPQVQFTVFPPTPRDEVNGQLNSELITSPVKSRTGTLSHIRPSLQGRDRSESFIKSLSRGISLRNAKNPKANQELDSTLHPFWRPRAFWPDDENHQRRLLQGGEHDQHVEPESVHGTETIVRKPPPKHKLTRSSSIAMGPASLMKRVSERRKHRQLVNDHISQQQALVKQTSYSSLQRFRAGKKLYGVPPLRSLSLNMAIGRLASLRERMTNSRARREDQKRELRREQLRKSIGPEVVMQSDSRFPDDRGVYTKELEHANGHKIDNSTAINDILEDVRAADLVDRRGLRL